MTQILCYRGWPAEVLSHLAAISLNGVEYGLWPCGCVFAFSFMQLYNLLWTWVFLFLRGGWCGCSKYQSNNRIYKVLVAQSYPTLCSPKACSPPGSSVHGILQARILEWVAMFSFKGSFGSRDRAWVSCVAGRFFTVWAIREAHIKGLYK